MNQLIVNLYGPQMSLVHKKIISTKHYLKTWRSLRSKFVFELINGETGVIVGLAIFADPCGSNVLKKYGFTTLELRRLWVNDGMEKNTTSWFLSRCLRELKKTRHAGVISYSDPNVGHKGTIYKATNFTNMGKELNGNPRVVIYKGKRVHMRQFYQKSKNTGEYVKSALYYQQLVKDKKAVIKKLKKKDVFYFKLKGF